MLTNLMFNIIHYTGSSKSKRWTNLQWCPDQRIVCHHCCQMRLFVSIENLQKLFLKKRFTNCLLMILILSLSNWEISKLRAVVGFNNLSLSDSTLDLEIQSVIIHDAFRPRYSVWCHQFIFTIKCNDGITIILIYF